MSLTSHSTKMKSNVKHRSDLLMDEHVSNVKKSQFELQSALQELNSAKSKEEIQSLRLDVADLKAESQKLVLALQVMDKINTELTFARADLHDALHKGIGDINAARKRVIWLEDKMGELCGRKRLKTRRPSNRFVTDPTYGWETDSEGEQTRRIRPLDSTENMFTSEQTRHQSITQLLGSEIGFFSDSEHIVSRQVGFQDVSSQSYDSQEVSMGGRKGNISSREDISQFAGETTSNSKLMDHRKSLHDSMASLTSGGHGEIEEESRSEKCSTVKEASSLRSRASSANKNDEEADLIEQREDDDLLQDQGDTTAKESSLEEGDSEVADDIPGTHRVCNSRTPISIESGRAGFYLNEEEEDDKENSEGVEEEERPERSVSASEEDEEDEGEESRNEESEETTFLTEVEGQKSGPNKVVMKAPEKEISEIRESTPRHDMGAEYWQSEHHRFEYSEFADVFTEINPLSYHQMGLAVPGSFIQREDTENSYQDLPWRLRTTGSDIKDIHRIALDKLATRVHGLYDKVYNATMLSVKPGQQADNLPREMSVFQSTDNSMMKPGSSSSKSSGTVPQTAPASLRQKTDNQIALPMGTEMKKSGTFVAGRMTFYPKPIPPPQVLPITRTSLNKEFPQFASTFSKPDPESRKPADRLVDQRNLMEETKLVLYREKVKPSTPGPTRLERRFRKMIEKDRAVSQKSSGDTKKVSKVQVRKKMNKGFKAAAIMAKFQGAVSTWNQIKPQSKGKEYSGLRWERVKTIVHMNLQSERVEERVDAAKQLGLLRCGDTMVFYALKERLHQDPVDRVKYESAKSLILIGCWESEVLEYILKYLVLGNTEIRTDLIQTLTDGKNVQYVDKSIPSFLELIKVLSHFCRNPDPDDLIAFNSAVCLGRLCVRDESAQSKLVKAMEESRDNHVRAKALEILVKQLHCIDDNIVDHVLQLLRHSPVWKYRALACRLLISLGPKNCCVVSGFEEIYNLLEGKLWDDPNMDVRLAAAKALTALGMFTRACEAVERKLEDADEDVRSQAVISVGTLGMRSEKLIRLLLEMLELDSSDFVRLMIVRTFGILKLTDPRVLRCLRERERLEGALARESRKALKILEDLRGRQGSKSLSALKLEPKYLQSRRVLSPLLASSF